MQPKSFTLSDYHAALDAEMLKHFAIDTNDAGIEPEHMAQAIADGQSPEDFALWWGEKYALTLVTEWKGGA